ncbi:hypothetical protein R3W88_027437 [Solanum pinnatisectum]|uniref:Uncharacterized protein n=1 Tax=Solanum pinnatisectum TaxID=50273 RepID=A0AAV9LGW8_9SOLN|nr:hypothetical protein R3W88_027437 [Solanum pinnatisectum]
MKDVSELQSSNANIHHTAEITEHKKNSTTLGTISSETREVIDTLIVDLGKLPIPIKPVSAVNSHELIGSHSFLSDSQLSIDISITEIVVQSDTNTPLAHNMMPSKNFKSPYLTLLGSSEKGKEVMEDVIRPYFSFEGYEITNQPPSYLIDEYIQWVTRGLLKSHANKKPSEDKYRARASSLGFKMMDFVSLIFYFHHFSFQMYNYVSNVLCSTSMLFFTTFVKTSKLRSINQYRYTTVNCLFSTHIYNTYERYYNNEADDNISTQEHIDCVSVVSIHKRSIINIMKGFSIPVGLSWHLMDDVYIPISYDG